MSTRRDKELAYLENENQVLWFLDKIPETMRTELRKLDIKFDVQGRVLAPVKTGCPFGLPCKNPPEPVGGDPPPHPQLDLIQKGPLA
ncbi:MAG TPA: hypothetical protein VKG23_17220 [Thermoanaerobaculia bacterium]|nr:hypothetical protein [Thermoanaerobaculia bacterium]